MKKMVVFGAGNIGRSLVGQLFSRAGYEIVFIDVVDSIVRLLNEKRQYKIEVKDICSSTIGVKNVRAVHGKQSEKVSEEIATADIVATAVGAENLKYIYANMAQGLTIRYKMKKDPIDIIICENVRKASDLFRKGLAQFLPEGFPLDSNIGLVETSIGKMVPIMTEEQTREDPLVLFAEAYNQIIADKKGFKHGIPKVEGLVVKDNISAYVDQKLYIHNMGHAITAYLGHLVNKKIQYIWEAIRNEYVQKAVNAAMWESGRALIKEYPEEFNSENTGNHINDLLRRFNNIALGDTIYRVGRDLTRKLSRNDRLIGALLMEKKHSTPSEFTTLGVAAAMLFQGTSPQGRLYPADERFRNEIYPRGINYVLENVCGLSFENENNIINDIKKTHKDLAADPRIWFALVA